MLENGKLDKREFLSKSYEIFDGAIYTEPDKLKTVEEGVFYYFYFNILAKTYMKSSKGVEKDTAYISNEYYKIKEQVLYELLSLIEDDKIIAYYVKTDSVKLKKNLVEINIPSMEKVIFHTLNPKTISLLKRKKLLNEEIKSSLIDTYINKKYY